MLKNNKIKLYIYIYLLRTNEDKLLKITCKKLNSNFMRPRYKLHQKKFTDFNTDVYELGDPFLMNGAIRPKLL